MQSMLLNEAFYRSGSTFGGVVSVIHIPWLLLRKATLATTTQQQCATNTATTTQQQCATNTATTTQQQCATNTATTTQQQCATNTATTTQQQCATNTATTTQQQCATNTATTTQQQCATNTATTTQQQCVTLDSDLRSAQKTSCGVLILLARAHSYSLLAWFQGGLPPRQILDN